MATEPFSDARFVESWSINAHPWTAAIREWRIESRQQVTDQAVIDAILSRQPRSVLDLGCGEGWLVRELAASTIHAIGADAVENLVDAAQLAGGGEFHRLSYEQIAAGELTVFVDLVVCNFALLGLASVNEVFTLVSSLLHSPGTFVVHPLHPVVSCGELPYQDGWRTGSCGEFSAHFSSPAP